MEEEKRYWKCIDCGYVGSYDKVRRHVTGRKHRGYTPLYGEEAVRRLKEKFCMSEEENCDCSRCKTIKEIFGRKLKETSLSEKIEKIIDNTDGGVGNSINELSSKIDKLLREAVRQLKKKTYWVNGHRQLCDEIDELAAEK